MATPGFSLAARLRAGETIFSAWCGLNSPLITGALAREGFNTVTIDAQHGMWDQASIVTGIASIRHGGAASIVRIPLEDWGGASRALDWGAEGIIAPMINTVADAKKFVSVSKFPPVGERSWGPHRATMLAGIPDQSVYLREANDAIVTLAMIETKEAMKNLDAIAAVPGIDLLFVGPSDLSINLIGKVEPEGKDVEDALDKVLAAAKKAGKYAGVYCHTGERARACADRGFRFHAVGSDLGFLRAGAAPPLKALKG